MTKPRPRPLVLSFFCKVLEANTDKHNMANTAKKLELVTTESYLDLLSKPRIQRKLNIARKHIALDTTPMMVLETSEAEKSLDYFARYLPFAQPFYAIKSNSHPSIAKRVHARGGGIDAASAYEVELALSLGFTPEQIILANPCKDVPTLHSLFKNKLFAYTYDSEFELHKIDKFRREHNYDYTPASLCRIKSASTAKDVQVNLSDKYGASSENVVRLVQLAHELKLNPVGLAFHVGSNVLRPDVYSATFRLALEQISALEKLGIKSQILDIGGGFPNFAGQAHGVDDLEYFYETVARICREFDLSKLRIIAEPGRAICGPTGLHILSVIGKRVDGNRTMLILDDGIYGCLNPVICDHGTFVYFPVDKKFHNLSSEELSLHTLAGPTCDSFDMIAHNVLLPKNLEINDKILIVDNGAYSVDTRTKFNGFSGAKIRVED